MNLNFWEHWRAIPPIDLHLIIENPSLNIKLEELDFFSSSNLIFAGYTGSKNQVRNKQKSSSSNLIFQNRFFKNQVQVNGGLAFQTFDQSEWSIASGNLPGCTVHFDWLKVWKAGAPAILKNYTLAE